jgi:hypothetical protein
MFKRDPNYVPDSYRDRGDDHYQEYRRRGVHYENLTLSEVLERRAEEEERGSAMVGDPWELQS